MTQPVRFESRREETIHRRLGLVGDGPQAFYRDALRLMSNPMLETTSHQVGHCLREIESALRDVLEPITDYAVESKKEKGARAHEREVRIILRRLGIDDTQGAGSDWVALARGGLHKLAHRRSLERPRSFDEAFREVWNDVEGILDVVLEKFEGRYAELHERVDRMLANPEPSNADLDYLKDNLPNNSLLRGYFFSNLRHPGWLERLERAGFFAETPPAIRDSAAGTIGFPWWPAADYLKRMASVPECQETVLEILNNLPETDNVRVHQAVTEVALELPPELARPLADRIGGWSVGGAFGLLPEKAGQLAQRFAKADLMSEAMTLIRKVLAVEGANRDGRSFEAYEYGEVLKNDIPELARRWPAETLDLLCQLLGDAMRAENANEDSSYIWRKSIESAQRWRRYEITDLLVDAVRDLATSIVAADSSKMSPIVRKFEAQGSPLFQRIATHLLSTNPSAAPDLVSVTLSRRDLFENWGREPEYIRLLTKSFGELPEDRQSAVLDWIEAGPDLTYLSEDVKEQERERLLADWKWRRLKVLKGMLPQAWEDRLGHLDVERHETEEEEDDECGWVGPSSPVSTDALTRLAPEEIAQFLKTWTQRPGWREPTPEGLGRALSTVVARNPAPFAERAELFTGLQPTYVRAILLGLRDALKESRLFPWDRVLDLCEWAVNQPREGGVGEYDSGRDPGWSWCRSAVADLIKAGVDAAMRPISFTDRAQVWRIIELVTRDPDPAPSRDTDDGEPLQVAINSVRGRGLEAVVRYGVWVTKNFRDAGTSFKGMTEIPELEAALHFHLDPERDPSAAVRAVLGEAFPVLHWIDPAWATANARQLFPAGDGLERFKRAAWRTYVTFREPFPAIWPILQPLYREAVTGLDAADTVKPRLDSYESHLAMHVMTFYWWGLDSAQALCDEFFRRASPDLRLQAVEFVGRSLANTSGDVPAAVLGRLVALWESRLRLTTESGASDRELGAFGWWLYSGKCDPDWAIGQALNVLRRGIQLEPDHLVAEYLAELVGTRPSDAVQLLAGLVDNQSDHWSIHGWKKHARAVLQAALGSGNEEAVRAAREVIGKLVARGHLEFRDLIK